jgi:hypothetical protein
MIVPWKFESRKSLRENKLLSSSILILDRWITYNGQTQSVCRLDRVNSSSCDYPETIPVDSNASGFKSFSSDSNSPEAAEFCLTMCLVYFIAWV